MTIIIIQFFINNDRNQIYFRCASKVCDQKRNFKVQRIGTTEFNLDAIGDRCQCQCECTRKGSKKLFPSCKKSKDEDDEDFNLEGQLPQSPYLDAQGFLIKDTQKVSCECLAIEIIRRILIDFNLSDHKSIANLRLDCKNGGFQHRYVSERNMRL